MLHDKEYKYTLCKVLPNLRTTVGKKLSFCYFHFALLAGRVMQMKYEL